MKKFVLIRWPDSEILQDQSWFYECHQVTADCGSFFVPEERYKQLKEAASLYPTKIFNADDGAFELEFAQFRNWIAEEVSSRLGIDYEVVMEKVDAHMTLKPVKSVTIHSDEYSIHDTYHNVHIVSGDEVKLDIDNDAIIVNGKRYTHD